MPVRPKVFSSRLDEGTDKRLKHLAVDVDKSVESLLREAIGLLFEKYREPRPKKRPHLKL